VHTEKRGVYGDGFRELSPPYCGPAEHTYFLMQCGVMRVRDFCSYFL
jgi:hypothetical protein